MYKGPGERLGISIRGGAKGHPGNPLDKSDEGIFVSKVNEGGVAFKDGRLKVGQRLLEVSVDRILPHLRKGKVQSWVMFVGTACRMSMHKCLCLNYRKLLPDVIISWSKG